MKKLVFIVLIFSSATAQELKFVKATMQTINSGASAVSHTNYSVSFQKNKKFKWSVDSVCSITTGQTVKYTIVSVQDPNAASPRYSPVNTFSKTDTGTYQITFGITKQHGSGRPGSPQNLKVDTTNIEGGVIIYYHAKAKKKQLKVIEFEQLETINAP